MLFMVIEHFKDNDMLPIYKRVRDAGRMLPDGLRYVDSWIEPNFARCFQLMECDDLQAVSAMDVAVARFGRDIRDCPCRAKQGHARRRRSPSGQALTLAS